METKGEVVEMFVRVTQEEEGRWYGFLAKTSGEAMLEGEVPKGKDRFYFCGRGARFPKAVQGEVIFDEPRGWLMPVQGDQVAVFEKRENNDGFVAWSWALWSDYQKAENLAKAWGTKETVSHQEATEIPSELMPPGLNGCVTLTVIAVKGEGEWGFAETKNGVVVYVHTAGNGDQGMEGFQRPVVNVGENVIEMLSVDARERRQFQLELDDQLVAQVVLAEPGKNTRYRARCFVLGYELDRAVNELRRRNAPKQQLGQQVIARMAARKVAAAKAVLAAVPAV